MPEAQGQTTALGLAFCSFIPAKVVGYMLTIGTATSYPAAPIGARLGRSKKASGP
jgi:hypothetical protein